MAEYRFSLWDSACNVHVRMYYACGIHVTCMAHPSLLTCMLHETCISHTCNTHVTVDSMKVTCCMHGTCMLFWAGKAHLLQEI